MFQVTVVLSVLQPIGKRLFGTIRFFFLHYLKWPLGEKLAYHHYESDNQFLKYISVGTV